MKTCFNIKNAAETSGPLTIEIYDQIGKDWFTGDGVIAKEFAESLKGVSPDRELIVAINSPGGSFFDGLAIYNLLSAWKGNVTTRNDGLAASVASVILMAGKKRVSNESALTMIHRASGGCMGNSKDMESMRETLEKIDATIAGIYAKHAGKTADEWLAAMDKETWMTGAEAKEAGLVSDLLETPNIQNSLSPDALAKFKAAPDSIKNLATQPAGPPEAAPTTTATPEPEAKGPEAPQASVTGEPQEPAAQPAATNAAPTVIVKNSTPKNIMQNNDQKEMFALAKRLNKIDQYENAIANGTSLADFRAEILAGITTAATASAAPEPKFETVGDAFINAAGYKAAAAQAGKREFKMEIPLNFRNATGTTSGLTSIQKQPGIVTLDQQPLTLASIIPATVTDATTIRYIAENSYTNAATAVAEEGQKPEASWDLAEVDATVRKIAVVGRVTDEMFADFAQMRDYVNSRLAFMVQSKEDNHLLNGTGSSNQIKGLLNFSGIQTQAVGANTVLDAIHKAITKVRSTGFAEPDAVVIHPSDYEGIKLMKDSDGQYLGVSPYAFGQATLWGLPVVQTTAIASGTALVGAYRYGSQIFRKLGLTVESTNSDASDFQYNRIAIRAETRLALACYRPLAFCQVTGIA